MSSNEINSKSTDSIFIKNIYYEIWWDSLVVKTINKEKLVFPDSKVWGYQESDCIIYRNYDQEFYKVRQIGSLIMYSQTHTGFRGMGNITYYFSKTLDSPIYVLKWKKCSGTV